MLNYRPLYLCENMYVFFIASLGKETITLSEAGLYDRQSNKDFQHARFRAQLSLHWVNQTNAHTRTRTHERAHTNAHTRTRTHERAHTNAHTHTRAHTRAHTHTYIHTHTRARIQ